MSHFTVLVIGDNPEEQLQPFQENNMGDCPAQYLEFHNVEDEYRKEYETDGVEMVEVENGELVYTWDDRFKVKSKHIFDTTTVIPDKYVKRFVAHKERYETFEKFIFEWAGQKKDELTGQYGYWENPNAKWDWYTLGGRWTGYFKAKSGIVGSPGLMTAPAENGYYDSILKKDLDLVYMRNEALITANKNFDKLMKVIDGRPVPKWSDVLGRHGEDNIDAARDEYNNNEVIKDLEKAKLMPFLDDLHKIYSNLNRESYVKSQVDGCITTFAVLYNGMWYERGKMGWWTFVADEKNDEEWNTEFSKLLDSLPDDTLLSVYDCHI